MAGIAAGDEHFLALMPDGTVVAWGDNSYGQCDVPAGLTGVVAVSGRLPGRCFIPLPAGRNRGAGSSR